MLSLAYYLYFIFFSTSYQLLRHFDLADVRGQVDALSYLEMTDLGIDVNITGRYRIIIPRFIRFISEFLPDSAGGYQSPFQLPYFLFSVLLSSFSALLMRGLCLSLRLGEPLSFCGGLVFLSGRSVIATCYSKYRCRFLFGFILFFYLIFSARVYFLYTSVVFLPLFKEVLLPLPFLLLAFKEYRSKKYLPFLGCLCRSSFCLGD